MFLQAGEILESEDRGRRAQSSRWQVESLLANGRHYRHYLVRCLQPELAGKLAVAKTIRYAPEHCSDRAYVRGLRARLEGELERLMHFSPRLPEPVDFFHVDNQRDPFSGFGVQRLRSTEPIVIQGRVSGTSLATLMNERGAPPGPADELLLTLAKTCGFLDELHAGGEGWLFAALCPEHIIVSSDELTEPRFVGCSNFRMMAGGTVVEPANAVRPEPGYAAPEQLAGVECDPRADVYAIGALLFHLFTGVDPRGLADELFASEADVISPARHVVVAQRLRDVMERFCRRNLKGLGIHRAKVRRLLLAATSAHVADRPESIAAVRDALLASVARSQPTAWAG